MPLSHPTDSGLVLDDGGLTFAPTGGGEQTGYGLVSGSPQVFDTGSATVPWAGVAAFETSALDLTSLDETYYLIVQGAHAADFSGTVMDLASWHVVITGQQDVVAVSNLSAVDNTIYRYLRLKKVVFGTTPSITTYAFLAPISDLSPYTLDELITLRAVISQNLHNAASAWQAWAVGVVGGGPNSDGKYPFSDGFGNTYLLKCPAQLDADALTFRLYAGCDGQPLAGQVLFQIRMVGDETFPAGLAGSFGGCDVAPTADVELPVKVNGVTVGHVDIAAGETDATVTLAADYVADANDKFSFQAPAVQDATLAGINFTFIGRRS